MKRFFYLYARLIVRMVGIVFLLVTAGIMFWNTQSTQVVATSQTSVYERMQAKTSTTKSAAPSDLSAIGAHVKERSSTQSQALLLTLFIAGAAMVLSSFLAKKQEHSA